VFELRPTMIEASCAMDLSGSIDAAPLWLRHIRPERKRSWLLVIRSRTSMGPVQTGQRSWAVISG